MPDIKERSLVYEGLIHYFIINFPQRSGALKDFLATVLSNGEDISLFQYAKKTNRNVGPALIGIELRQRTDYPLLIQRMEAYGMDYTVVNENPKLFGYLI
jgi:threonine dehydratase